MNVLQGQWTLAAYACNTHRIITGYWVTVLLVGNGNTKHMR